MILLPVFGTYRVILEEIRGVLPFVVGSLLFFFSFFLYFFSRVVDVVGTSTTLTKCLFSKSITSPIVVYNYRTVNFF